MGAVPMCVAIGFKNDRTGPAGARLLGLTVSGRPSRPMRLARTSAPLFGAYILASLSTHVLRAPRSFLGSHIRPQVTMRLAPDLFILQVSYRLSSVALAAMGLTKPPRVDDIGAIRTLTNTSSHGYYFSKITPQRREKYMKLIALCHHRPGRECQRRTGWRECPDREPPARPR
jgi:hypothetical protein